MKTQKVEKWKLTPEQLAFQKKFKKVKGVEQALKLKLFQQMLDVKSLSEMLSEVQGGMKMALKNAPATTRDIEGQS